MTSKEEAEYLKNKEEAAYLIDKVGVGVVIAELIVDSDNPELREELIRQLLDRLRWRNTKEDPPKEKGEYIVYNGQISTGEWYGDRWGLYNVTHWMPMPEPPTR